VPPQLCTPRWSYSPGRQYSTLPDGLSCGSSPRPESRLPSMAVETQPPSPLHIQLYCPDAPVRRRWDGSLIPLKYSGLRHLDCAFALWIHELFIDYLRFVDLDTSVNLMTRCRVTSQKFLRWQISSACIFISSGLVIRCISAFEYTNCS
jgi:hypothetical protein